MSAEDQTITAKFIADTAGFDAGADDVIGKSQSIEAATSGMSQGMQEAGTAMSSFGSNAQKAGEGAGAAAVGFKSIEESAGALSKDTEGAASGIAAVGDAGSKAAKGTEDAASGFVAVGKAGEEAGSGAKAASGNIEAVGTASSKAATEASTAGINIAAVGKSSEEAGSSAGKAAGGFSLMEGAMVAMMAIQIAQMIAQMIAALDQAYEAAQRSATAFTYLTGSADKAQQELHQLSDTWAAARFGTQNIDNVAQHLLMGGEDAKKAQQEIERVSDAVAAMGGSAQQIEPVIDKLHSIQQETKVSDQDMQELAKDGIDGYQALAEGLSALRGHTVDEAEAIKEVKNNAISGNEAYKAMMVGMQQYAGAAAQSTDTLSGKWQETGSKAQQAFEPAIEVLKRLIEIINGVLDAVNALNDALHNLASSNPLVKNIMDAGYATVNPFASFGSGFASGGSNLPSGWRVVGEDGPELQWSPGGDTIVPNGANPMSFLGLGGGAGGSISLPSLSFGGGPQTVELHIHMDSATIARQTIPLIAPQIRVLTGGRK